SGDAVRYGGGAVRGLGGLEPIHHTLNTTATKCSDVAGSPYPIVIKLGANANYDITPINGSLTIVRRPATVTANPKVKKYGEVVPALDATVGNEATGCEPVHYTLGTIAGQFSDVPGPYAITVTLGANPNYDVTPTDGALTVQPAPVTVTASNKTKIYGDPNPPFDAAVTGEVGSSDAVKHGRVGVRGAVGGEPIRYTLTTT